MDQTSVPQSFDANPGVMYKLGNIEAQLKSINEKLDKKEGEQDEAIEKLKTKVSKLEEWRAYVIGVAAVVSIVIGFVQRMIPWQNLL